MPRQGKAIDKPIDKVAQELDKVVMPRKGRGWRKGLGNGKDKPVGKGRGWRRGLGKDKDEGKDKPTEAGGKGKDKLWYHKGKKWYDQRTHLQVRWLDRHHSSSSSAWTEPSSSSGCCGSNSSSSDSSSSSCGSNSNSKLDPRPVAGAD